MRFQNPNLPIRRFLGHLEKNQDFIDMPFLWRDTRRIGQLDRHLHQASSTNFQYEKNLSTRFANSNF
jgi:hypothetical protein